MKYVAAEADFNACKQSVVLRGGMSYSCEFHVERLLRKVMIPGMVPVSQQMALNFLAERAVDLPKSY